jgi:hypothetical protein
MAQARHSLRIEVEHVCSLPSQEAMNMNIIFKCLYNYNIENYEHSSGAVFLTALPNIQGFPSRKIH